MKAIVALFALTTILLLVVQPGAQSEFVMPAFEVLRQHTVAIIVALVVLLAMKAVSAGPGLR